MLLGLQDITFEFGARTIVKDATWHIQPNERIGLIGYNGTGKSTLLRVMVGEYKPSKGTVERSRGTSIGYLHQDLLSFDSNDSILGVAMGAFERVQELQQEITALEKAFEKANFEHSEEASRLGEEYAHKLHDFELLGGYTVEHRTEEVLQGLGFAPEDLARPYREFSGGWRMRVLLAKMILQQPDLLLLDEPTNHLDLPSIEWLERYLQHYKGSVVIVSHDKYFLNRMVTKIVELYQQELHFYKGNYAFYETEKEMRMELQQQAFENQQEYIRQQERFIERFRAKATKAAAAQSAIKRLDKLDRIEDVTMDRPSLRINFDVAVTPGKVLCTLKNLTKKFGNLTIVENTEAEIERGDKIALIGANGKGKSTLLRVIAGTEAYEGERKWGHNVEESFYAQHQLEALDLNHEVIEEMKRCGSGKTEQELRTLLGCFLFSGDDVEKKIRVLSGGEKARVALAKTIVSKANFLLLDEPTNHLDIHSVELLIEALNKYEGTIILVSHDRYFISRIANKIWEIENKEIKEFKGGYEEQVAWKERMAKAKVEPQAASSKPQATSARQQAPPEKIPTPVADAVAEAPAPKGQPINKELKKEYQKQQRLFQQTDEKIAQLKARKVQLEADLAAPDTYSDRNKFVKAEAAYQQATHELEQLNKEYEALFEKIMALEEEMGGAS
jgi:ATP-binding cassette, subfamily F, member 3